MIAVSFDNSWADAWRLSGKNCAKGLQYDHAIVVVIRLFNPSTQNWFEHFSWSKDGLRIIGMTPCGCATVSALRLNNPLAVRVRRVWVKAKEHPPLK